jgi:anthranilate/para-aminobenzoate synthase component I
LGIEPAVRFGGGPEALREAARWLAQFRGRPALDAVLMGAFAYELGACFADGRLPARGESAASPVELAGFRAVYAFEPATRRAAVVGGCARAVAALAERLASLAPSAELTPPPRLPRFAGPGDSSYLHAVELAKKYIRAGDVYQVNLARRLAVPAPGAAELRALYARLAEATAAPFSAYLESAERTVLSSSPERFLRSAGGEVETCPIKGTRPRGGTPAEDARLLAELLASAKDRAEHVMIVDLERNDLGRVCEIGSVRVPELCAPRSFSDVHHLVSSVRGRLREPADWPALLEATFPGGSITGAPKVRAMQIIAELEPCPRDVYTGALGAIDAAGDVDLSIAIRTAVAVGGDLQLHLGGGIVADSDPERELAETRDKGRGFARSWAIEV